MDDLISRQAAIDAVQEELNKQERSRLVNIWTTAEVRFTIVELILKQLPTAEPKTGRWEKMEARGRVYRCNQCGNFLDFDGVNVGRGDANYCPNCGAKMEGVEESVLSEVRNDDIKLAELLSRLWPKDRKGQSVAGNGD